MALRYEVEPLTSSTCHASPNLARKPELLMLANPSCASDVAGSTATALPDMGVSCIGVSLRSACQAAGWSSGTTMPRGAWSLQ